MNNIQIAKAIAEAAVALLPIAQSAGLEIETQNPEAYTSIGPFDGASIYRDHGDDMYEAVHVYFNDELDEPTFMVEFESNYPHEVSQSTIDEIFTPENLSADALNKKLTYLVR